MYTSMYMYTIHILYGISIQNMCICSSCSCPTCEHLQNTFLSLCVVCCTEMKTLDELAQLDVDLLSEGILPSSSLSTLREAVLQLELQLWLREEGLEELLPQLTRHGHTSKDSLLDLKPASLIEVKDHLHV